MPSSNIMNSVILAIRIPPEVRDGIAKAAKRSLSPRTEYLRRILVECVARDGGFSSKVA